MVVQGKAMKGSVCTTKGIIIEGSERSTKGSEEPVPQTAGLPRGRAAAKSPPNRPPLETHIEPGESARCIANGCSTRAEDGALMDAPPSPAPRPRPVCCWHRDPLAAAARSPLLIPGRLCGAAADHAAKGACVGEATAATWHGFVGRGGVGGSWGAPGARVCARAMCWTRLQHATK